MKKLFVLLSLFLIHQNVSAQFLYDHRSDGYIPQERNISQFPLNSNDTDVAWSELHPNIPRVHYMGVYFINPDTGFAVGDGGALIKTTNGGQLWSTRESGVTAFLKTIGSFDGEYIIAAGDSGKIISSTDYGESWHILPEVVPYNLWNIQFITKQIGWLVGEGASALKTIDGGRNWINQQTPLIGYPYFDVSFADTSVGYISTAIGRILRTTTGGSSWDIQILNTIDFHTIEAITRSKAMVFGQSGRAHMTTNSGESWDTIFTIGPIEPVNSTFIDSLNGFLVGFGGSFVTTDGGLTWTGRGVALEGLNITFANSQTGYIVGTGMVLRKSTDSGQNWFKTIINDHFSDVFFTNKNSGWFIGRHVRYFWSPGDYHYTFTNSLYQTTDGGKTLVERNDFPDSRPSSVYFLDSTTGLVGANNKIFRTINGGSTWQESTISNMPGNSGNFERIFFIDENTGWARGIYLVKTTDGGKNWNFQIHAGILNFSFYDQLNGWGVRGNAKPLKTTDGGKSWIEQTHISLGTNMDVFFKDASNGFIIIGNYLNNRPGFIYKTTNSGITWGIDSNVSGFGNEGRFSNFLNHSIYVSGEYTGVFGGYIYKSSNEGVSWNEVEDLRYRDIRLIRQSQFVEKFDIAIGGMGQVFRFNDSIIVGVNENTIIIPQGFNLHQNYPNPFNANTAIEFALPIPSHVKISIYDITGRLITELINGELNPGVHKVIFNGEQLSSGIYYFKLESGKFNQTRKMILLK